jgi:GNAT superfamily N-acetyltransferase
VASLRSFLAMQREIGFANAALLGITRSAYRISAGRVRIYRYCFVAQPISTPALAPSAGILIRRVDPEDPLTAQFPRPRNVIVERFASGALCLAAERRGLFAGYIWLKEHSYLDDEARCEYLLPPRGEAVWDFDVYVDPAFRHGRMFARLWSAAHEWMRERGYRWSISRISAFNSPSLSAHRRLGTVRLGTATFVQIEGLQLALLDRAPYLHFTGREGDVPRLRFAVPGA